MRILRPERTPRRLDKLYHAKIKPNLPAVRECRASGGTAAEVCRLISVSPPTLRKYLRLAREGNREYSELSEAYDGHRPDESAAEEEVTPEMLVERALYSACCGYTATVKKHYKLKQVEFDPQSGKKLREWEELKEATDEVHVPASIMAQRFYLMNRLPERWQVKPAAVGEDMTAGVIVIPEIAFDDCEDGQFEQ